MASKPSSEKPKRIDPRVADGALRIAACVSRRAAARSALRWPLRRRAAAARPSAGAAASRRAATSLTQLPRRIGLVRDAPDCFASVVAWPRMPPRENFFTPSTRRHSCAGHARDAVVLRQRLVQERVVGVEDVQHRAVVLEQVGEEPNRLLVHRAAQAGERREMPLALLVELVEVVDVQPLAGELGRQPAHARVAEASAASARRARRARAAGRSRRRARSSASGADDQRK